MRGTASFDVFCVKISFEASAVASWKNQKKNEIIAEPDELYFTHMGRKNPWKSCIVNRQSGVGDFKYVVILAPLLTGHVIQRWHSGTAIYVAA